MLADAAAAIRRHACAQESKACAAIVVYGLQSSMIVRGGNGWVLGRQNLLPFMSQNKRGRREEKRERGVKFGTSSTSPLTVQLLNGSSRTPL